MQMNGLAELITIAKYWQDWDDPRLVVLVLHNNDLNQVTWELRATSACTASPSIILTTALQVGRSDRRRSPLRDRGSGRSGRATDSTPCQLGPGARHGLSSAAR